MLRAFWTVASMMVLGIVAGALVAGAGGGALGALVGSCFGLMFLSVRRSEPRMRNDVEPERVRKDLLCIPRGRVAECRLVRDKKTGIWLDVERCSLERDAVRCAKRCLVLMNDAAV